MLPVFYRWGYQALRTSFMAAFAGIMALSVVVKELLESGFFQAHRGFAAGLADGLENMFLWSASNRVAAGIFIALLIVLIYAHLGSLAVGSLKKRDL